MATLTIRDIPARVLRGLEALATRHNTSIEQEVRELLEEYATERFSVLKQIESSWKKQKRRPSAREIDRWIGAGRQ